MEAPHGWWQVNWPVWWGQAGVLSISGYCALLKGSFGVGGRPTSEAGLAGRLSKLSTCFTLVCLGSSASGEAFPFLLSLGYFICLVNFLWLFRFMCELIGIFLITSRFLGHLIHMLRSKLYSVFGSCKHHCYVHLSWWVFLPLVFLCWLEIEFMCTTQDAQEGNFLWRKMFMNTWIATSMLVFLIKAHLVHLYIFLQ